MNIFIIVCVGTFSGFVLEFVYKSITHHKILIPKLINVQMYLYTAILLYILLILKFHFLINVLIILLFTTGVEFLIGRMA